MPSQTPRMVAVPRALGFDFDGTLIDAETVELASLQALWGVTRGSRAHFDVAVTRDDVLEGKPAPLVHRLAWERLAGNPAACIAFETLSSRSGGVL